APLASLAPLAPLASPASLAAEAEAARSARLGLSAGASVRAALLLDEVVLRARLGEWSEVWVLARLLDEELGRPGAGALTSAEEGERTILGALAAEQERHDDAALE